MLTSDIQKKLAHAEPTLMTKANVVGLGVGEKIKAGQRTGQIGITVLVTKKEDELPVSARIPETIDGVPTDIIEVGEIVAHANTTRMRPAPAGVSVGNTTSGFVGTLGYFLRSEADGQLYLLSNNHVIANANLANFGDNILQPGAGDGGNRITDAVATLYRFPLLGGNPLVDCAIARVVPNGRTPQVNVSTLDGFGSARQIPGWFGAENQGGGAAAFDISNNGQPDIVVFHLDNPGGENHGYYRIGWNLDTNGNVTGGWTAPILIPGWFGAENQGGGIALADLNGNGRPDLLVFHIDNPGGENRGYYRIGWNLDTNGNVTGGWSAPMPIPGWFGAENQGGGIALADVNGNGRPDLIAFHIDNPGGENRGYYRIGWNLDSNGAVTGGWTNPTAIPGWFGAENQGGDVAVADVNGDGRPELVVVHVDNPGGENTLYYRYGTLQVNGTVPTWNGPRAVAGWAGSETQGMGLALTDFNGDGRPEMIAFHLDNPNGENHGYLRAARSLFANVQRWGESPRGTAPATVGRRVWKSGRTTELTNSMVLSVNQSTGVNYTNSDNPALGTQSFRDQILVVPPIGRPGDSGSTVVDSDGRIIGLYFAGSSTVGVVNRIENVLEAFRFGDPRPIPGWFGAEDQGGDIATFDISGNGRPDLVVLHLDNPSGENHGYYRVGWNLDGNGIARGGWTNPIPIPGWFGSQDQGGGIALADINGNGRPDLVVFHLDNPGGENRGYYRIGWNVETNGNVTGSWTNPIPIPGWFGAENQGGGIALADLNGNGRPDLIVFHLDNPGGENRGYYRIGWNLDLNGNVSGGWTNPIPIPGWFGAENQGGGIAVATISGTRVLIAFHIDNPAGENHGYYRIGWGLDGNGIVRGGWSDPMLIPGWFGSENQAGGLAVADLTANGRPDLIVFQIDNPGGENRGYYRVVYDLMPDGRPARWFIA